MSELKITQVIEREIKVKFPTITHLNFKEHDETKVCLLDESAIKKYNCQDFPCSECYFGLSVFTELSDVPDQ